MSTPDGRAEIIAGHADYVSGGFRHCSCGQWSDERPGGIPQADRLPFARHVERAVDDLARAYEAQGMELLRQVISGEPDQPDDAPVQLAGRIHRSIVRGLTDTQRERLRAIDLTNLAHAVIDELIDLAGTGKLLRGIAEYRRPHA